MPFEAEFWKVPQYEADTHQRLSKISGFITAYPINWTKYEDNNMKFHHALMTHTIPAESARSESLDAQQIEKQIAALSKSKPDLRG